MNASGSDVLLSVRDLRVQFTTEEGIAHAVDGVGFDVKKGETFCLVGESGCGKSVTALSIMRLIPTPPGRIASGSVVFDGRDLTTLPQSTMRRVRGAQISMVFQEPMSALNPVFTVGNQITEAVRIHQGVSGGEARDVAIEMLRRVRIPEPEQRFGEYPHQMSGGMLQRVVIAMALVCRPSLLIADEPTTALDVTVQARILDLLKELQQEMGMSVLMITHDLGVVAQVADRVAVMYAGRIVETADVRTVFERPMHPYMISLMKSMPVVGRSGEPLNVIPGQVPDPRRFPEGCRFHPRCYLGVPYCATHDPELREVADRHAAACLRAEGYWPSSDGRSRQLVASELRGGSDG
jgi:oligopeptide/dipeptide ABC transporter ATP-binding protein